MWTELGWVGWARVRALSAQEGVAQEAKGTDCRPEASRSSRAVVGTQEMIVLNGCAIDQAACESDKCCAIVLCLGMASMWEREVGEGRQRGRRR